MELEFKKAHLTKGKKVKNTNPIKILDVGGSLDVYNRFLELTKNQENEKEKAALKKKIQKL